MKFRAKINGEWTDWVDKETLRKMNISAFTWIQGEGSQESNTAGNTPALADFWESTPPSPVKATRKSARWIWTVFLSFILIVFVLALWESAKSDSPMTQEDKIEFYHKTLEQVTTSYEEGNLEETKKSILLAQSLEKDLEVPRAIELEVLREQAIDQGERLLEISAPERALLHFEIAQTIQNNRDIRRRIRKAKAYLP